MSKEIEYTNIKGIKYKGEDFKSWKQKANDKKKSKSPVKVAVKKED